MPEDLKMPGTDEDYNDLAFNFGIEAKLLAGLTLAANMRDSGELSLRLDFYPGAPSAPGGVRCGTSRLARLEEPRARPPARSACRGPRW